MPDAFVSGSALALAISVILCSQSSSEPPHDKTNKMTVRPAKTQINLGVRPVWSESSLCAQWIANDLIVHSDRIGCPGWSASSLGAHAILLVLSWGGSSLIYHSDWNLVHMFSIMIHWISEKPHMQAEFRTVTTSLPRVKICARLNPWEGFFFLPAGLWWCLWCCVWVCGARPQSLS